MNATFYSPPHLTALRVVLGSLYMADQVVHATVTGKGGGGANMHEIQPCLQLVRSPLFYTPWTLR